MGNPFGRSNVIPLTNQSGGSVAAGDLVYLDTGHDDSFTTGTTAAYTGAIGIAQQAIGAGSVGLVLVGGYASLVNVNASVTRGHFGQTHTVAKQAADAGASRQAGTCMVFLKGGTTPDAQVWQPDLGGGSGMTNPMTTTGDIIYSSSGSTPAARGVGNAGAVLAMGNGLPIWNAGTSFPGTPATGDRYWRTDRGLGYYYDGTRWLSETLTAFSMTPKDNLNGTSTIATNAARIAVPFLGAYSIYVVGFEWLVVTGSSPYSGSVYWTAKLNWATQADADSQIGTTLDAKTATVGNNNYNFSDMAVNTVLDGTARELKLRLDPVGSPTAISYTGGILYFRLVG